MYKYLLSQYTVYIEYKICFQALLMLKEFYLNQS